jgi:hypothetical protein
MPYSGRTKQLARIAKFTAEVKQFQQTRRQFLESGMTSTFPNEMEAIDATMPAIHQPATKPLEQTRLSKDFDSDGFEGSDLDFASVCLQFAIYL